MAYFERYAQEFIAGLERKDATTQAVTKIILANLDDVSLSIRKVAKEMAMSVRTLQNRLSDEGVVFSDLMQDIRERLAKRYLSEDYTVEQITYLLGFSEPSTLSQGVQEVAGHDPAGVSGAGWVGVEREEYGYSFP